MKLFFFVTYEFSKQVRVFVYDKPFQPSLMFASKAGAYPRVEHLKMLKLSTPQPYSKILD
jgi:hypothetical protein